MKKIPALIIAAIVASASATMQAGTPILQSELPKAALTFIAKHFPNDKVRKAEKDNGRRGTEYEVDLAGGAEIDFRSDGEGRQGLSRASRNHTLGNRQIRKGQLQRTNHR